MTSKFEPVLTQLPCNVQPETYMGAFNCPHCGAYAQQQWYSVHLKASITARSSPVTHEKPSILPLAAAMQVMKGITQVSMSGLDVSRCQHCKDLCIWISGKLSYPDRGLAPPPNTDLPEDIKGYYEEAGAILDRSPRGAAALLRLCIQKLCVHLGERGKNLNADIGALVENGLPVQVQQALDIVRVIGNDAVHPGTLDMTDDTQTATTLFGLVNVIANDRITQPKEIDELYETLPEIKRQAIATRDQKKSPV